MTEKHETQLEREIRREENRKAKLPMKSARTRAQARLQEVVKSGTSTSGMSEYHIENQSIVRNDQRITFTKKQKRWMKNLRDEGYGESEIRDLLLAGKGPALTREQKQMLLDHKDRDKPRVRMTRSERKRLKG